MFSGAFIWLLKPLEKGLYYLFCSERKVASKEGNVLERYGIRNITQAVLISFSFFFFCIKLYEIVSLEQVITFRCFSTGFSFLFSFTVRIRDNVCGCLSSGTSVRFA